MGNDIKPEITVVILTYNPVLDKLIETLLSVLVQSDVSIEIVFADDGSVYDYSSDIDRVMRLNSFSAYRYVRSSVNRGTVLNCYSALKTIETEYVKLLSPGDLLIGERVLSDWLENIKTDHADISFSGAVYYYKDADGEKSLEARKPSPKERFIYSSGSDNDVVRHYLLYDDITLGPAVLLRLPPFLCCLEKMLGKVKYAEDSAIRLMIAQGATTTAFDEDAILYEADSGISASNTDEWNLRLKKDWCETDELIANMLPDDTLGRRIRKKMDLFAQGNKLLLHLCFPIRALWRLKTKIPYGKTSTDAGKIEPFLQKIGQLPS